MALDFDLDERRIKTRDFCSKAGAGELKQRIEDYWRERGHEIQVDLQESGFHPVIRSVRYDVRSTLRNGYPPKKVAAVRR